MIKNIVNNIIIKEYKFKYLIFSIISGILLALSFQKFNFYLLAWVSLVPLIYCIYKNNLKEVIICSFTVGLIFNVIYLYWMFPFLLLHTEKILDSCIVSVITWLYFAIYFIVWSMFFYLLKNKVSNKILFSISVAAMWTILDFLKAYILTGLSWNLLAYTQTSFLYLIQICDIFGVYLISFVIVFVNMLIYFSIREKKIIYLVISLFLIILLCGYGYLKVNSLDIKGGKEISVGVVQPNIEQYKKWDDDYRKEIMYSIENLVLENFGNKKLDLLVYPETMLPGFLEKDLLIKNFVKKISNISKINLIGGMSMEFIKEKHNSIFVISQEGEIINKYNKKHLIIFGEYIPFDFLLSKSLTNLNVTGTMVKEKYIKITKLQDFNLGISICSENYYPGLYREFVLKGANLLTIHVNDAWVDGMSAIYQHFVLNVFRAIENRKYLIVSANTGISGVIAPTGKIIKQTKNQEQVCFEEKVYTNNYITIYDKIGDLFVYLCMVYIVLVLLIYGILNKQ